MPAPLQLLFRRPLSAVSELLQSMASNNLAMSPDFGRDRSVNSNVMQYGSLGFDVALTETVPSFSGFKAVFFDPQLSEMQCLLSVSLGSHLEGGERTAPVAQAFLAFGAMLAANLSADAVVWNPARLISEPAFYIDAVERYAAGGVFPVLVYVDLDYQNDETLLLSRGLSWFSGQEIALEGNGLRGQELTRRAVRLIHDMAVNGPVAAQQNVPDMDAACLIELNPAKGPDNVLRCHIRSRSDAKGKALTLH